MTELRRELPEDGKPPHDEERPIMDHLMELAVRLRRILAAIIIMAGLLSFIPVNFKYYIPLISYFPNWVINHILPKTITWKGHTYTVDIVQYNPFAGFNLLIKSALLLGVLGASPIIAKEIYEYIEPALYPHEKKKLKKLSFLAIGLFILGIVVAFLVVLPLAFRIMFITSAAVSGRIIAFSDVEKLFSTAVLIAVATGIAFEAPLIVYLLVSFGIIEPTWFEGENKKWVLLASMLLGAAISPDPSGIGMLVIGTLMYISIMTAAKFGAKTRKEPHEENQIPRPKRIIGEKTEIPEPQTN